MKLCSGCQQEIPADRLVALPKTDKCVKCSDELPMKGTMVWEGKHTPVLHVGKDAENIMPYQRRGFSASLPFNTPNNPRMQAAKEHQQELKDLRSIMKEEPTIPKTYNDVPPARCHPNRPRVSPAGLCVSCAVAWYDKRNA